MLASGLVILYVNILSVNWQIQIPRGHIYAMVSSGMSYQTLIQMAMRFRGPKRAVFGEKIEIQTRAQQRKKLKRKTVPTILDVGLAMGLESILIVITTSCGRMQI